MASRCILKCYENPLWNIVLPDMKVKFVGRSRETRIVDKRCSRKQVEFCANYKCYELNVTQVGPNPSSIKDILLPFKNSVTLMHGDDIELIVGKLKYAVCFEPSPLKMNSEDNFSDLNMDSKRPVKVKTRENNKRIKTESLMEWEELFGGELLVLNRQMHQDKEKVAAYDMDGTLIATKSGLVFPKDPNDWRLLFPQVPGKLKEMIDDDYKLVIFTNQGGISLGKQTVKETQFKISAIIKQIGLTVQVLVSTGKGNYRKPMTGMWDYFLKECNGNLSIWKDKCVYIGDAAGRTEIYKLKKKDFSCADRLFALNIGIPFYTPEEHFLGEQPLPYKMPPFDPRVLPEEVLLNPVDSKLYRRNGMEVILLVGYPGSGKSHFYHTHLQKHGYAHVSRDNLGSWQKCVSVLKKWIKDKISVVIDNTNPDVTSRKRYLEVANDFNVPVRCFILDISLEQSMHNNKFRELTGRSHMKVNTMVYNSYKSKYQEPTFNEGFNEIVKVNFVPKFENDEQKQIYTQFLL